MFFLLFSLNKSRQSKHGGKRRICKRGDGRCFYSAETERARLLRGEARQPGRRGGGGGRAEIRWRGERQDETAAGGGKTAPAMAEKK